MSKISFRPVTEDNWNAVVQLYAGKEGSKHVAPNTHTVVEAFASGLSDGLNAIYANKILIGLVWYRQWNKRWPGIIFISRFMLDEKFQGKGLGTLVFGAILRRILRTCSPDSIWISADSEIALHIYRKAGFVERTDKTGIEFKRRFKETLLCLKNETEAI